MSDHVEKFINGIFEGSPITLNGPKPWDIQIHDKLFYKAILHHGLTGLGESYMSGYWDCEKLDEFFYHAVRAKLYDKVKMEGNTLLGLSVLTYKYAMALLTNLQNKSRSLKVGTTHYDVGNHLYRLMLDERMNYSCGYWKNATTLEEAQEAKLKLICDKLYLEPGMKVLDIGCGWGSFAKYAAQRYGVEVVGITISQQQLDLARELCAGLPIELRFQDYRDVQGSFDCIVSIGMIEHVGYKNYRTYMEHVQSCLNDDGLFLLQTIGNSESVVTTNTWLQKYIFPNGMLPSIKQLGAAYEGHMIMEDWHNFGPDYDKTLLSWYERFNNNWAELKSDYDERFHRMWNYYLLSFAGAFRARMTQVWQVVFSKNGVTGGYNSLR